MKVLLLGVGLQGRAALVDLVRSSEVEQVIAVDREIDAMWGRFPELNHPKVTSHSLDVSNSDALAALMKNSDAVIHLLPGEFRAESVRLAIANSCHFVDASYANADLLSLSKQAQAADVSILPEFGLDPGIDLVLAARGISELDSVHSIRSYGAGIPEKNGRVNALDYKISWSFQGVLSGYRRPAQLMVDGRVVEIPGDRIFSPENIHIIEINGLGTLEAYPNGDAVRYLEGLGGVQTAGRYSMRWPGHADFWRRMVSLGFLEEAPPRESQLGISPRRFVYDLLFPQLQYGERERDIAIVRVELDGLKDGQPLRLVYQVLDYRDLDSGLMAMQRTVGFSASIGVQMILGGEITKRGLLSPLRDVPPDRFIAALRQRGILVQRQESAVL